MDIRKAVTFEDYKRVEEFLSHQVVPPPPIGIKHTFNQGYQNFLNMISPDHETWYLSHEDSVSAVGSLLFKKMIIEGEEQNVGVTSFMRVKPDAKSTLLWTKNLLPQFTESMQKHNCKYIFSFTFHSLRSEVRKFRQAVKLRDEMPRFYLVRKASYINLHGRIPWRSKALKSVHIRKATLSDIPQILEFTNRQQLERQLKEVWDEHRLTKLIEQGSHDRNSFWIALDFNEHVVGHFLPLELDHYRSDIMLEVTPEVENYHYIQRFFSWLNLATPPPKKNHPIPNLYLSNIEASNQDIFETLLRHVYKFIRKKKEIISYTHFAGNLISRPPKCFMYGGLPMDFYLILPPQENPPEFLKSYWLAPTPEFEALTFA